VEAYFVRTLYGCVVLHSIDVKPNLTSYIKPLAGMDRTYEAAINNLLIAPIGCTFRADDS
jgi:hypothetical protein